MNTFKMEDYLMNPAKRDQEISMIETSSESFKRALFYMYGSCEGLEDNQIFVHELLKNYQVWNGTVADARKYLKKQIVVQYEDDLEEDLSETENIVKFLNRHSKFGKNVKEIEEIGEILSSVLYKVVGSAEEVVIKGPKKIKN